MFGLAEGTGERPGASIRELLIHRVAKNGNSPKFGLRIVHRSLSERREYGF
jgi:hypothetical protein